MIMKFVTDFKVQWENWKWLMSVNPLSSETCKMIEGFNFCSSPYFSLVYCWKGVFVLKLKTKFKAQLLNDWKWTLVLKAGGSVPLVFRCTSWMISCHRRTANCLAGRVSVCGVVGFRWPSQWHLCNPRTPMCNMRSLHESLSCPRPYILRPLLPQAIHTLSFQSGWVPTMLLLHCYTALLLWWTNYWHRLTHYTKKKKEAQTSAPHSAGFRYKKGLLNYFNPQIWGPAHKALLETQWPLYALSKQTIVQVLSSIYALLLHSCPLYKSLSKGDDTLILRARLPDRFF